MIERLDHLVYGTPHLEAAVEALESLLGVRASPGGRHSDEGTRNALIALGPASYLEVLAPDPQAAAPPRPRWFGIDDLVAGRLVAWAAKGSDLTSLELTAHRSGIHLGQARRGSRQRPDGETLSWSFTDPRVVLQDGLVPFFIDWGDGPHPAATAAPGCRLLELRAEHPEAEGVRRILRLLVGIRMRVDTAPRPALVALIQTPTGTVELR